MAIKVEADGVGSNVVVRHVDAVGPELLHPLVGHIEHTRSCADLGVLQDEVGYEGGQRENSNTRM